jgi:hypothetical protein
MQAYYRIMQETKQKLYEIMKMQLSAVLGKAKPDTENIRGLNLAAVKRTTRSSF